MLRFLAVLAPRWSINHAFGNCHGLLLGASHGWFAVDQRMVQAEPAFVSIYTDSWVN